ncbi:12470_t:CDS:2 [Funneliformis caledonium]|uniref:12470_t:CDS:1 n=1 Tax=Funneliformis caledonium TaxID=1117310 RepID=A0A9N9GVN5_9GLOM|nr:12470_t:CDS:2 [Funneliformis caledonium]
MTYKRRGAQSSETSNRKYHNSDEEHSDESSLKNTEVTREARGAVRARGLRRSRRVEKRSHKTYYIDNREIIMRSRSHTLIITPDITSPTSNKRQQSRRSTPIVEPLIIVEPAQSQHSTSIKAFDKNGKIVLDDSTSILREEVPSDNYSKKKNNKDHEDDEPSEDQTMFGDTSFKSYDKLFE